MGNNQSILGDLLFENWGNFSSYEKLSRKFPGTEAMTIMLQSGIEGTCLFFLGIL